MIQTFYPIYNCQNLESRSQNMSSNHRHSPSRPKQHDNSRDYRDRQHYHRSISSAETSEDDRSDTRSCSSHNRKYDRNYYRSNHYPTQSFRNGRDAELHYQKERKGYDSFSDDSSRHGRTFFYNQGKRQGKIENFGAPKDLLEGQVPVKKQKYLEKRPDQQHENKTIQQQARILVDKVQTFDYRHKNSKELKEDFFGVCHEHLSFKSFFPQAIDDIGKEILKNGVFHEMWGKCLVKSEQFGQELFQEYYDKYRDMIEFGLTGFEKMFNSEPEEDHEDSKMTNTFKRYRSSMEQSTRVSTKMDCMLLFQQVKEQIRIDKLQQKIGKNLLNKVEERRLQMITSEPLLQTGTKQLLDINYNEQSSTKQYSQIDKEYRQESIKNIQESRKREKSPFSSRFRMMHECQSNERRMCIEAACMFFKVEQYYHINDVEIVSVEESIFSQKQEIVVVKAYTVDFSKEEGKYTIEPKMKNLIAAYKFSGVLELIRLEQTYGKFDGMVVYAERFDIKKYLKNQKQITPNKEQFAKEIKEKITQIQNQEY